MGAFDRAGSKRRVDGCASRTGVLLGPWKFMILFPFAYTIAADTVGLSRKRSRPLFALQRDLARITLKVKALPSGRKRFQYLTNLVIEGWREEPVSP
jgi:hypothetical protein